MKKMLFNDKFLLTKAVLEGRKTQTRRILKSPSPYKNTDIAFPVGWINEDEPEKDPLYGAFCWVNKDNPTEHTEWVRPQFRVGEVVAVAQSYKDAGYICHYYGDTDEFMFLIKDGSERVVAPIAVTNKMFVRAELMPHQIRITDVHPERLQDISDEDCLAEGIVKKWHAPAGRYYYYIPNIEVKTVDDVYNTPKDAYSVLIDKVSGKGTWESNPWVWAYTFELVK